MLCAKAGQRGREFSTVFLWSRFSNCHERACSPSNLTYSQNSPLRYQRRQVHNIFGMSRNRAAINNMSSSPPRMARLLIPLEKAQRLRHPRS